MIASFVADGDNCAAGRDAASFTGTFLITVRTSDDVTGIDEGTGDG